MQPSEPIFPRALAGFDPRRVPVLRTDVLVIGAGVAGASAALAAADAGASVLLLTKTPYTESNTAYAQGGMCAVVAPDDSPSLHGDDTLRVGAGLGVRAVADSIIGASTDALNWLQHLGARFDRTPSGALELSREGGHSVHRVVHANGDATGAEIQRALTVALQQHPSITARTPAYVRDLLVEDGRCVGAVGCIEGTELAVVAGAVVVAAGGAGQVYRETTNPIGACGDGIAMCFRAGARVADAEFVQFHPTTLYIAGASRFLISEVVRGAGAVLRDKDGVRFMAGAHPDAELAPRDVVSRAILQRMVETGDTHVYLDLAAVDGDPHARFPSISRICKGFDIDIGKDPVPVRPGAHYSIGGVVADIDGHTDVAGLFAAGEVTSTGFHGANRLASNSLLEGAVIGRRAGTLAAAAGIGTRIPLPRAVPELPAVDEPPRIHLDDMLYSLKSLMWRQVGLLRDADGIGEALRRIGLWNHYLLRARPRGQAGLELANMLTVSALIATAASRRTESRGVHYRVDHPERDDANWCRHIFLQRDDDGGGIETRLGEPAQPTDQAAA